MEVTYHRLFQRDVNAGVRHYDDEGGEVLGDAFFSEVERAVELVIANPTRFHFIADGYRRAQLKRFPYHIIFEESEFRIKFLILRHDKRHPNFGMRRR